MFRLEKKRFSIALFAICMCEFLFWSIPMVAAAYDGGVEALKEEQAVKSYLLQDKDSFVLSNVVQIKKEQTKLVDDEQLQHQQRIQQESMSHSSSGSGPRGNAQPVGWWSTMSVASLVAVLLGAKDGALLRNVLKSSGAEKSSSDSEAADASEEANRVVAETKEHKQVQHKPTNNSTSTSSTDNSVVVVGSTNQSNSTAAVRNSNVQSKKTTSPSGDIISTSPVQNEYSDLTDDEILAQIDAGKLSPYTLETSLEDSTRAVAIRRKALVKSLGNNFDINAIPYENYDYEQVRDKCCENVIGYVPIPIGIVGPVLVNGKQFKIPMATTEGCLVASTHRGCKAITMSGGANSVITDNGMSRGPAVRLPNVKRASQLKAWIEKDGYKTLEEAFNSTTRFGKLKGIKVNLAGRNAYMRFKAFTGDAMGMNMISKGVEKALVVLQQQFQDMEIISISGNFCTDKKPAAVNWIEGRGRSVVADCVIKGEIIEKVLKTSVAALVDVNINKNLVGSAMAGSVGGFNAHASNIVTAIYLATGQDPAQNVESSNCMTLMEAINDGKDLYMSVTMPSIEVGTVGGGTALPAQAACLEMLACKGADKTTPGKNADQVAILVAVSVLAGELSLMSALAAGHLVKSHMQFNRGTQQPQQVPTSKL